MQQTKTTGGVFRRGDSGYEQAVLGTSFSARDPGRRPEVVVQANTADEVVAAVRQAAQQKWHIAMCSGGHSWAQNHIREGGLMLDLSRLKSIDIDPARMTAVIGPGVLAGELNLALVPHRLFFPTAHAWTVGMGGFLLQGGFGWNSRNRVSVARTSSASTWSLLTAPWCMPVKPRTPTCSGPPAAQGRASSVWWCAFTCACTSGPDSSA